jgi:hypothetical protein
MTWTVSANDNGTDVAQPSNLVPVTTRESATTFVDFFDWSVIEEEVEDAGDVRETLATFGRDGLRDFVRIA